MRTTYKIRKRSDPNGNTFYQLTIPREWIEQTRATEIQFKKGDDNQLIIVPVTFSDDIAIERPVGRRFQLRSERTVDERMEDLFFSKDEEENQPKKSVEE